MTTSILESELTFQEAAEAIPDSQDDFKSDEDAAGDSGGLGECK